MPTMTKPPQVMAAQKMLMKRSTWTTFVMGLFSR
jgi:hypothetical protein